MKTAHIAIGLWICGTLGAQDPYRVAADHYHLLFENEWVRATRVTYGPHESAPVHQHPPTPTTLYVYLTNGGTMRFHHVTGDHVAGLDIDRKPVKAGGIRFAHGAPETHSVDYLGDSATEYVRVELRTEPLERPVRDVRLPPSSGASTPGIETRFENRQARILHVVCAAGQPCPQSAHPKDPSVVITMSGPRKGEVEWSPVKQMGPAEQVRLELKSKPVGR
jgi:hypothetical protein